MEPHSPVVNEKFVCFFGFSICEGLEIRWNQLGWWTKCRLQNGHLGIGIQDRKLKGNVPQDAQMDSSIRLLSPHSIVSTQVLSPPVWTCAIVAHWSCRSTRFHPPDWTMSRWPPWPAAAPSSLPSWLRASAAWARRTTAWSSEKWIHWGVSLKQNGPKKLRSRTRNQGWHGSATKTWELVVGFKA